MATVEYDTAEPGGSGTRRYRSPLRRMQAAQTRAVVLEAATRLFAEHGWVATGMRDVARAAAVSVETVYTTFGSKADLLKLALEVAIVGDDAQVPLADRPVYTAIGTGRTTSDRIEMGARMIAMINERIYRLAMAIRQGATADATLAAVAADLEGQRRRSVADVANLIMGHHADPGQVDELWVQTHDQVYALLVDECGWSRLRYESWLIDRIAEIFDRPV
ncbi:MULTISPECIES: helix-turn-helix domain-containing protein [Rhodococcus]|uniref:helix-turn-helix domain-containing protein n=1 Tax=Rhodococcus TaxID=1827 RepID=UPI0002A25ABF|nr:TetR/AcrR family transcriptional regulator [Rhodococcus opacus]ELB92957.1 TetR family transcriptional regulator [Rhodococcus wratislaviensis IFP 2016]NHU46562.1 TetR/AcrR family transcriptional regulator [Rhodococcus sp. A14]MDJ0418491.1 helix-turn-helix domain-containing protein [Rhodococcus opacus]MDX5964198.1 helix-turn-helix domain-containing protein [Rhodococcus opacus]NKY74570.1 TetR/AcrR family transcriptional regulator [Rhodococcus opacus]